MQLLRQTIETPVGSMTAIASGSALVALEFGETDRHARLDARRRRWFPPHRIDDGPNPIVDRTSEWLADYFAGRSADSTRIPIEMYGSDFERRVWRTLLTIPPGATTSYGEIADTIGLRNGARAVGLANGANPIAIIVPCHRVIGSNGTLTGYGGGLDRKRWLLEHEQRWSAAAKLF